MLEWKRDYESCFPDSQKAVSGQLKFEIRSYHDVEEGGNARLWKAVLFGTWEEVGHVRRSGAEEACERLCERLNGHV